MSGGIITVALGVFERISGKTVPLWLYGATLIFFAFLACYLAWRESQRQRVSGIDADQKKRAMIAARLEQFIKESPPVAPPWIAIHASSGEGDGLADIARIEGFRSRVVDFLEVHWPERVKRFEKDGTRGLEELLAECLEEEDKTKPKIKGRIEEVIVENALPEERIAGFDYYITIRFWLRNESVATNFRTFELWLFAQHAKQSEYKGDRLPLAGLCLDRKQYQKTGAQTAQAPALAPLQDYDAATPLEPWVSREGWLRFVIRNVEYADTVSKEGKGFVFDRLELWVTDGSGKLWTLTTKPPWLKTGPGLEVKPCPGSSRDWIQLGSGGSRARFQRHSG